MRRKKIYTHTIHFDWNRFERNLLCKKKQYNSKIGNWKIVNCRWFAWAAITIRFFLIQWPEISLCAFMIKYFAAHSAKISFILTIALLVFDSIVWARQLHRFWIFRFNRSNPNKSNDHAIVWPQCIKFDAFLTLSVFLSLFPSPSVSFSLSLSLSLSPFLSPFLSLSASLSPSFFNTCAFRQNQSCKWEKKKNQLIMYNHIKVKDVYADEKKK